ncbi:outer membrane beta-barrel protein [Algoriphagus taiwanensis]|uniref:Outer membrane protein beta-barrel domain-containing protein n=1 Tax=Algoriphagus taiwanensis TaxID=1445656 RepID=A0ABQ6Q1Z5_9BACT|nr:hypothetical protein Ataiwa_24860 [Algoriphagus taiwanensis]
MKKLLIILCSFALAWNASAQEIRLNTYAGYVFDDRVDSYFSSSSYYEGTIKGGFQWGAGLEYKLPNGKGIELQYLRQDTQAPMIYQDGGILGGQLQRTTFDLANNWIMVNGNNYFQVNDKVEPYFGAGIGMVISNVDNPDNGRSQNFTKFAWALRGGSNFWLAEKVGIKLQASLMSAVQGAGGGFYFGTGGVGTGVSTYSTIFQFGFQGGLVFRFSN